MAPAFRICVTAIAVLVTSVAGAQSGSSGAGSSGSISSGSIGSGSINSGAIPLAQMPAKHRSLISTYCLHCHDSETKEGSVDLERLSLDLTTIQSAEQWQKVLGVMNSGEMPPSDEPAVPASDKTEFLADLAKQLVVARKLLSDQGGEITMRRLNRREYANTIRDLLGVEVIVKDLPDDANSGGFDTAGSALFLSSDQIEKYLQIARTALDTALAQDNASEPSVVVKREPEDDANEQIRARLRKLTKNLERAQAFRASDRPATDFGFVDEDRVVFEEASYRRQSPPYKHYLGMPETKDGVVLINSFAGAMLDVTRVPDRVAPGDYVLRLRVGALKEVPSTQRYLEYGRQLEAARTGEMDVQGCRYIHGTIDDPEVLEIPVRIPEGKKRLIALRSRQHNNQTEARRLYQEALAQGKSIPDPSLWIDWVELVGPVHDAEAVSPRRHVLGNDPDESDASVRQLLTRFAERAFRIKKPSPAYLSRLVGLYHDRIHAGDDFEEAIKEPLSVILASPSFLYLREPADSQSTRELTDKELAVRLAYFLWSGPPDEELIQCADRGELSQPSVLAEQIDRMILSPRASEFVSGFTHQWLSMDRLDFFQFDPRLFPQFDASVKAASRLEVYRTIETLLRDGLSIGHLLDSDFVVVNDLLANYYGIDGVDGHAFRKVNVPEGMPRGGLLGMAAVLAMGSDGTRSSPVERGAWVLRKLLADPPPPAPANVPQLSRLGDVALSSRAMQQAHQDEPQCAQCHRKIDPIGFGLENFDAAGQWRLREMVMVPNPKKRKKTTKHVFDIDPAGTMPDGTPFASFEELRSNVSSRELDFARGFTEALIEYGLGRPYSFSDDELAATMMAAARSNNLRLSMFIHSLVQSKSFRSK